jgi:hypothetical protein
LRIYAFIIDHMGLFQFNFIFQRRTSIPLKIKSQWKI